MINYLKGIPVKLSVISSTTEDSFGNPVPVETQVTVDNVLVASPSGEEIVGANSLYGKKLTYTLGIPKGDTNNWEDTFVEIDGKKYRTFGPTEQGIEALVPGPWHKKVMVEKYE